MFHAIAVRIAFVMLQLRGHCETGEAVALAGCEHIELDLGSELGEIAKANPDVTIGSYPFFDDKRGPNTNIVVRARDQAKLSAARKAVEEMLTRVRAAMREKA